MGPNRTKLVTPNSSLKFTPEELVLYCRDLRVVCFLFDRLTPDAQVLEVCVFFLFFQLGLFHGRFLSEMFGAPALENIHLELRLRFRLWLPSY